MAGRPHRPQPAVRAQRHEAGKGQAAQATASLPLEPDDRWLIDGSMNDYVLGHSLRAVAAPSQNALEDVISEEDLADHPEMAGLPESLRTRSSIERFEAGLEIVLDGVEKRFLA